MAVLPQTLVASSLLGRGLPTLLRRAPFSDSDTLHGLESLGALAELLDHADHGHWPTSWSEACTVLISKSPESPPGDRYRIWARKHAFAPLKWLNSWAPPSLGCSRRGFSADAYSGRSCRDHQSCLCRRKATSLCPQPGSFKVFRRIVTAHA